METGNFKKNDFLGIARLYEPYYKTQINFITISNTDFLRLIKELIC